MIKLNDLILKKDFDLDKYIEFREYVKSNMEHPEWLGDFSKNDIEFMLAIGAEIWNYSNNEELVCSIMLIPSSEKDVTSFDLACDYKLTIDCGPTMVSPKYVGNGLMIQMMNSMEEYVKDKGFKYIVGTVHPDNKFSLNNFKKLGYREISRKEFKRGLRAVFFKEL